jgi:hypothetical protein
METIVDTKSHSKTDFYVPEEILQNEKKNINHLKILYDTPFVYTHRSLNVGGRNVDFDCFHYTAENLDAASNLFIKKTYINAAEPQTELYRWESKAAMHTFVRNKVL